MRGPKRGHRVWILALLMTACSHETRVSEVAPSTGTFAGGEEVEIRGANIPPGQVTVRFGSKQAGGVAVQSDHVIKAITPPGEKDTAQDIAVTFSDGRTFVLKGAFRYIDSTRQRETMDEFFKQKEAKK